MQQVVSSPRDPTNVVVIGAGLGGMAAAVRLAASGHKVTLCERGDTLGGRAREFTHGDFRWDAGPTVLTGPYMFEDLFAAAGRDFHATVELRAVNPFYRVFGADGACLDYTGDVEALIRECQRIDPASEPQVRALAARTARLFAAFHPYTERHMMQPIAMVGMLPYMLRHRAFRSIRSMVRSTVRHPFLRSALEFHPLLIGGNPATTPALYGLISEFERRYGVHYAVGGTSAIVQALTTLLSDLGVTIKLSCSIAAIESHNGAVTGVRTAGGEWLGASIVVSNADPEPTRAMTRPRSRSTRLPQLMRKWHRPSMSLHVFYFGTSTTWPHSDLAHHSLLLPDHPDSGLESVFKGRQADLIASQRFLYVHLPSRTDPSAAPPGCESLYVLVAEPALRPREQHRDSSRVRADVLSRLEPHLPGISGAIVSENHIGPEYFRDVLGSPAGQAFGLQPTLMQSAWFRPHNRQRGPRGLYLVGAGTHPGAGVPAVLASAKIACDLIAAQTHKSARRS